MTTFEIISSSLNVVLVGVVILTEMRARRNRPKLKISLYSMSGASNVTRGGAEGRYFILNIANRNAHAPAVDVKLLIVAMSRSSDGRSWRECPVNGPVRVSWRRPNDMQPTVNVGPDVQCTVLALVQGEPAANIPLLGAVPNNFEPIVKPNEYVRLTLQAVGDNCRSGKYRIQLHWDGHWPEEGVEGHITVSKA